MQLWICYIHGIISGALKPSDVSVDYLIDVNLVVSELIQSALWSRPFEIWWNCNGLFLSTFTFFGPYCRSLSVVFVHIHCILFNYLFISIECIVKSSECNDIWCYFSCIYFQPLSYYHYCGLSVIFCLFLFFFFFLFLKKQRNFLWYLCLLHLSFWPRHI